jgi:alpha-glucan, water dikinase
MRDHGIREGHRPGLDEPFLEQWHQKLHTSTTPEDVTICEAYLDALRSGGGDMAGAFYGSLWHRARISREDLAGMARPITAVPMHLPHLTDAFQGYLWTLKATHGGADLDTAAAMAAGALGDDLAWQVRDLASNRGAWWAAGKAVDIREALLPLVRPAHGGQPNRDVSLLDAALEDFFRLAVERTDTASLATPDLVSLVRLVLRCADVGRDCPDVSRVRALWDRLGSVDVENAAEAGRRDWARAALAACQRGSLALAASADRLAGLVQPAADAFRAACVPGGDDEKAPSSGLKAAAIAGFGEEVARGAPVAVLATLLRALEPRLRGEAGVGPWSISAPGPAGGLTGRLQSLAALADVAGLAVEDGAVLVAGTLDGSEDIPAGVAAVLTAGETDVLSHVAIRARAQGVLLASCADGAVFEGLVALDGRAVGVSVTAAGDVVVVESASGGSSAKPATTAAAPSASSSPPPPALTLAAPTPTSAWALSEAAFAPGLVGGKALNLAALRSTLAVSAVGSDVLLPASVALPFGTAERVLAHPANADTAAAISGLEADLEAWVAGGKAGVPSQLASLRAAWAGGLAAPPPLVAELGAAAAAAGLAAPGEWENPPSPTWPPVWAAVCGVWASKWGDRAWLSRRSTGVPDAALSMAVLLQSVIPAAHAFVLHTADPLSGDGGSVYGEVVLGMGEALVGAAPGRAASFRAGKKSGGAIEFLSWPAKRDAWYVPSPPSSSSSPALIARSDSNGEDLADFAGAGLYDSVPVPALAHTPTDLAGDEVVWWGGGAPGGLGTGEGAGGGSTTRRAALLARLRDVGVAIEAACGGVPQDIEGVVTAAGEVGVVQARAQIL